MDFEYFVKELPNNCIVNIRISDNVLDGDDWAIHELIIQNDVVIRQHEVMPGAYEIPNKLGWTTKQLCAWSHYDNSCSHPEEYHEIQLLSTLV